MEFVEAIEIVDRMCSYHFDNYICIKCPLDKSNNGKDLYCNKFINAHPKEAEEIIMKWAEEHPIKTNRQAFEEVLKEKFGDTFDVSEFDCRLLKQHCPKNNIPCEECDIGNFWNKEYKEVSKDASSN